MKIKWKQKGAFKIGCIFRFVSTNKNTRGRNQGSVYPKGGKKWRELRDRVSNTLASCCPQEHFARPAMLFGKF